MFYSAYSFVDESMGFRISAVKIKMACNYIRPNEPPVCFQKNLCYASNEEIMRKFQKSKKRIEDDNLALQFILIVFQI